MRRVRCTLRLPVRRERAPACRATGPAAMATPLRDAVVVCAPHTFCTPPALMRDDRWPDDTARGRWPSGGNRVV